MDNVYNRIAKNIVGQAQLGNVGIVVFVNNGAEKVKLVNAIAALQYTMGFEGHECKGKLEIFRTKITIIKMHKGAVNGYKYGDARIYSLNQ